MKLRSTASTDDVFINCPFDAEYASTFEALIFAIYASGFRPRSARELDDGSQTRIEKLYDIVRECRFGVHDVSRTQLDRNKLPRFNMPLELGIFLGAKRFGSKGQKLKRCLIMDIERYRYQKFISDLSGMDIHAHGGKPERAIECIRDWLANVSRRQIPSARLLIDAHKRFLKDKAVIAAKLGFEPTEIPYADFGSIVTNWLLAAPKR